MIPCTSSSLRDSIRRLVHVRFGRSDGEGDEDDEGEDIHAIGKMTFLRWLFFVFGGLGPGIKLMAMEGVHWTKAWGVIFLTSFVVVEALVIFSWIDGVHEPVHEPFTQRPRGPGREPGIDCSAVPAAHFLFVYIPPQFVLLWVVIDIWSAFSPFSLPEFRRLGAYSKFMWRFDQLFILEGFPAAVLGISIYLMLCSLSVEYGGLSRHWYRRVLVRISAFAVLGFIFGVSAYTGNTRTFVIDLLFIVSLIGPSWVMHRYMHWFGERWPRLAKNIFLTFPEGGEMGDRDFGGPRGIPPDDITFLCFVMFLYTTVLSVIWYAFIYNPEGTGNRGWTGIFG